MSAYLVELSSSADYTPSAADIDELKTEVLYFTMASHLLWTFWAFVNLQQDIEFGYLVSCSNLFQPLSNSFKLILLVFLILCYSHMVKPELPNILRPKIVSLNRKAPN